MTEPVSGVGKMEEKLLKQAKSKNKDAVIISEIIAAQRELDELKEEYGLQEEEKGIKKAISNFFDKAVYNSGFVFTDILDWLFSCDDNY